MPVLIVEHSGKRKSAPLNGRATVGRTLNNDIVIDHPAVSRTHAVIEREGESYFISDAGSKNGTVVGDNTLAAKRQLADGDRIAIGPAVLTFHASDEFAESETHSTLSETHAGMLMDCDCGAKLWVPKELIGGRGQCQKCGRQMLLAPTPKAPAPATRICSICQWKIEPSDKSHTCPACGLVVHEECWQENRGCSAYGCSQVNVLDKPEEVDAAMEEIGHPPVIVAPQRTFPWEFALLAASLAASLIGLLLFGALALVTMFASGMYLLRLGRKCRVPVLVAAMGLSLVGLIAGVVVSCFWWLNLHLHTR
jgi:hypothetical protein